VEGIITGRKKGTPASGGKRKEGNSAMRREKGGLTPRRRKILSNMRGKKRKGSHASPKSTILSYAGEGEKGGKRNDVGRGLFTWRKSAYLPRRLARMNAFGSKK